MTKKLLLAFLLAILGISCLPAFPAQCNNTPVGQAITCIASANNRTGGSSSTVTFPNGYAAGDTVIVAVSELNPQLWRPNWNYPAQTPLIDSSGNIQMATLAGMSGATPPAWNSSGTTIDHNVTWTFVRKGRLDPAWLSTDISNAAGFHWNFWRSYASGIEDANVVQIALYYAVAPSTSSMPDAITVQNPDGTYVWHYAIVYRGLGDIDGEGGYALSWGGPGMGDATTGNYMVTPGDLNLVYVFSAFPTSGAGWNERVTDVERGLIEDQIAASSIANGTVVLKGVDGYFGVGLAFKPLAPKNLGFTPATIPPATQGVDYKVPDGPVRGNVVFAISGGTPPYTCSTGTGSLPPGMSITTRQSDEPGGAACMISGTPTTAGNFGWTQRVTDSASAIATGTASLVVISSHLPTLSADAAKPLSPSSEIITWTSDVPSTSQVCYSTEDVVAVCTAVQDVSGVTSHSVTLTNLWPGTTYSYFRTSDGVAGQTGVDYLRTTDLEPRIFTTAPAVSTGAVSFQVSATGPHDILQGGTVEGRLDIHAVSGTSSFKALKIVAYFLSATIPDGTPAHVKIRWPDQQTGSARGVVSTTWSPDDTLTFTSLADFQATRFAVLSNVGGATQPGYYLLSFYATWETGSASISANYEYNVHAYGFAPMIAQEPHSLSRMVGQSATFSVVAAGIPTPTYQWEAMPPGGSFSMIPGAVGSTFTIPSVGLSANGYQFRCVSTNGIAPDAVSRAVTLQVSPGPPGNPLTVIWLAAVSVDAPLQVGWEPGLAVSGVIWKFTPVPHLPSAISAARLSEKNSATTGRTSDARILTTPQGTIIPSQNGLSAGNYAVTVQLMNGDSVLAQASHDLLLVNPDLSGLKVFPNPWRSDRNGSVPQVTFDGLTLGTRIRIFTNTEREVKTLRIDGPRISWDLTDDHAQRVANGTYTYVISDFQGHSVRGKLSINR